MEFIFILARGQLWAQTLYKCVCVFRRISDLTAREDCWEVNFSGLWLCLGPLDVCLSVWQEVVPLVGRLLQVVLPIYTHS